MYELLLVAIVILLLFFYFPREHFGFRGQEILNIGPFLNEDTCKPSDELQAGLCYTKCRAGYHGVGPVCWADSENVGIGTVIGLEDCPKGWFTEGLICREPITGGGCRTYESGRLRGLFGEDWGPRLVTTCDPIVGGRLKGRLDNGGVCPGPQGGDYYDRVDGMCYRRCPTKLPKHIPGMPYLCYIGGDLSYGRGVGKIPAMVRLAGKYPLIGGG